VRRILPHMRRGWLLLVGLFLVAGAGAAFAIHRGPDQAEVSADALPVVATAHKAGVYVDCSKVDSVAYFADNPCQTFVLLTSKHFRSAVEFWAAETRAMRISGWRHSAPQLVDYDGANSDMASLSESWVSPAHRACAYVATGRKGVVTEAQALFPYDPYDIPHGVYVFYRTARAAKPSETLWVRLRPPNPGGRCIG
jgi:hypothetical protein